MGTQKKKQQAQQQGKTANKSTSGSAMLPGSQKQPEPFEDSLEAHLKYLEKDGTDKVTEMITAPLFTEAVRQHDIRKGQKKSSKGSSSPFSQYGLLAGDVFENVADPRVWFNTSAPSSVFICGSQGSGKTYTLSCLLENCLMQSRITRLPNPLAGLVFHYDTFISDTGGTPCEVAHIGSSQDIQVRVLCAPTNLKTIRKTYAGMPNVTVQELRLNETHLNTKRMLDLMAASTGSLPLYLHVLQRVLRDMRIAQQHSDDDNISFKYQEFRTAILREQMTEQQCGPGKAAKKTAEKKHDESIDWTPTRPQLTIVDLSCPCVTAGMACQLFTICLSLFFEKESTVGRVVALDEAHKYMTKSDEAKALTELLLGVIRLQRHLGARVFISTQEPMISPKLLDLCSVTIVHRFTSPDWLASLKQHLAGVSLASQMVERATRTDSIDEENVLQGLKALSLGADSPTLSLFSEILALRVGEALIFAPSAMIGVAGGAKYNPAEARLVSLGHGVLKVRIRNRLTHDGGKSVFAK